MQVTDSTNLALEYPLALNPNGGNVGIGESSPTQKLQVAGSIGTNDYLIHNGDTNTKIGFASDDVVSLQRAGFEIVRLDSAGFRVAPANNIDKFRINTDGSIYMDPNVSSGTSASVGIGTQILNNNTGTYAAPLHIYRNDANASSYGGGIQFHRYGTPSLGHTMAGIATRLNWASSPHTHMLSFYCNANTTNSMGSMTPQMCLAHTGYLGIGTNAPYCPLHVNGTGGSVSSAGHYAFKYNSAMNYYSSGAQTSISIYANDDIVSGAYFVAHGGTMGASDERIKKNIVDANDSECLETLRLLKPKKYQYRDVVERGEEPVWGFIAQEVKDTLPHATQLRQDVLPNIYELANVSSSNVITFTNFNTSNLESNATTLIRTMGADGELHDVHLAEVIDAHTIRVKEDLTNFSGSVDAEGNVISEITTTTITPEEYRALTDTYGYDANITGYKNANVSISVEQYMALEDGAGYEEIVQDYTKKTTTYPGNQLFVHGQEVDDFVFLKKEAIWTIATAALQEVDRQLQAEKAKVADLLARVTALENA
jgi:hypothetical protein